MAIERMESDVMNDERLLLLSAVDNVFVAVRAIERGSLLTIGGQTIHVAERDELPLGFREVGARQRAYGRSVLGAQTGPEHQSLRPKMPDNHLDGAAGMKP